MKEIERRKLKDCCNCYSNILKEHMEEEIPLYSTYEELVKERTLEKLSVHFGGVFLPPKNWLFEPDKKWIQFIGGNKEVTLIAVLQGIYEKNVIDIAGYLNNND